MLNNCFYSLANFLYKCPASRGGSLRQHGLLVMLSGWYCPDPKLLLIFILHRWSADVFVVLRIMWMKKLSTKKCLAVVSSRINCVSVSSQNWYWTSRSRHWGTRISSRGLARKVSGPFVVLSWKKTATRAPDCISRYITRYIALDKSKIAIFGYPSCV